MQRMFLRVVVALAAMGGLAYGQVAESAADSRAQAEVDALQERVKEVEKRLEDVVVRGRKPDPTEEASLGGAVKSALKKIELDASLSAAFTYNLANPDTRRGGNRERLVDPDHNTFGIPYARLGVGKRLSGLDELDLGFRIDVAAGRMVEETYREDRFLGGEPINLPQAYLELQVPTPLGRLSMRAGRQDSYFGVERYDPTKNVNFSLSHVATFMPKTLTGASLGWELTPGLTYTQWVGNGWDAVVDNNEAKSTGGQLNLHLARYRAKLVASWLLGAERSDSQAKRWVVEGAMEWQPLDSTFLKASLMYGQEGDFGPEGEAGKFGGFVVIARQGFFRAEGGFDRLALGVRGSYLRDQDGVLTGADRTLAEVTGTIEIRPLEFVALRFEYRHDWSSDGVFLGGDQHGLTRDQQDTLALELSLTF